VGYLDGRRGGLSLGADGSRPVPSLVLAGPDGTLRLTPARAVAAPQAT
jgi:hypothetical protein